MANTKKIKDEAISTVDAALAILNKFPQLDEGNMDLSIKTSINPFDVLMELFKPTVGYDILIKILSTLITTGLPPIELGIKTILLQNIKNLLTCSVNPFISDKLLREGIVFNLSQIDINDTLRYSPLSKIGKYYYFGCDYCETADDVRDTAYFNTRSNTGNKFDLASTLIGTRDMNALLWFMRNRASRREVWGSKLKRGEEIVYDEKTKRMAKKHGILTFEYNARPQSLKNAEGGEMGVQTPGYDMIHVFLGNTCENVAFDKIKENEEKIKNSQEILKRVTKVKDIITDANSLLNSNIRRLDNESQQGVTNERQIQINILKNIYARYLDIINNFNYNPEYDNYSNPFNIEQSLTKIENWLNKNLKSLYKDKLKDIKLPDDIKRIKSLQVITSEATTQISRANSQLSDIFKSEVLKDADNTDKYPPITKNYYYHKTLIEFNYDYIFSLKLFDEKVIAAQLLDALTGLLSIDLSLSYKQMIIREETKKMITNVIETDDTVVNDCFFTFSNDDYDKMLRKADLRQAGLFTVNGEENTIKQIDAQAILDSLNGIDENASKETIQSIIQNSLTEISGEVTSYNDIDKQEWKGSAVTPFDVNAGARMNFIENLMSNLAYVITSAVLSPKVYLLILINLKLLGENTDFDLQDFIAKFNGMLVAILREIRDRILKYLVDELMKYLGEIAKQIAVKIGLEQAEYYTRLIKKIIDCIKLHKGTDTDFNIDDAIVDIYDTDNNEPVNNEC